MAPPANQPGPARILAMGLWLGAAYGFFEAAEWYGMSLLPGRISWVNGNSVDALWVAPTTYLVSFGLVGLLLAAAARLTRRVAPRVPWDVGLLCAAAGAGTYLAASQQPGLEPLAEGVLALGVATELTRQYLRRRETWSRFMARSLPYLVAAIPVVAALVVYGRRATEGRALAALPAPAAGRPNVLLLVIDTERADRLSAYGYARATTPNLDRLAKEGVLFEHAYSAAPWTLPSHATMFTGEPYVVHRAGYVGHGYLEGKLPTLAEVLRDQGYATAGFVANIYWTARQTRINRGFLHYEDFYGSPGDAFNRTVLGRTALKVAPRVFGDIAGRKSAAQVNGQMLDWLDRTRASGRPFFAFLNYFDQHRPYNPPAPFSGRFSAGMEHLREKELDIGHVAGMMKLPPPDELAALSAMYDESLAYVDAQIGALADALEARGMLDNTIVIVTSDHGEAFGEHGFVNHGASVYIDQLHVPLIVRFPPKIAGGARVRPAVSHESLAPTVMELVGLPRGPFRAPTFAEAALAGDTATAVSEQDRRSQQPFNWPASLTDLVSVADSRFHLIVPDSGRVELYEHAVDPREERDLSGTPAGDSVAARLRRRLSGRTDQP